MPVDPSLLQELFDAADATYKRTIPNGLQPLLGSDGNPIALADDWNGFYAEAFIDGQNNIIVAYEGASNNNVAYDAGSHLAEAVLFEDFVGPFTPSSSSPPPALLEAAAFLATVAQANPGNQPIYVTGHSLGGTEAEYAAWQTPVVAGGVTFASTGVPGYIGTGNQTNFSNFTDYVENLDPIGNQANALWMQHYGTVQYIGPSGLPLYPSYNSLEDHYGPDIFQPAQSATIAVTLSGSVSVDVGSSTDAGGNTTYSLTGISTNVTAEAPALGLASLSGAGLQDWSDSSTWSGYLLPSVDAVTWVDVVGGVAEQPFLSVLTIPQYVNTLGISGPTNGPIDIPGLSVSVPFASTDAAIDASVALEYAIAISGGSHVFMDQPDVLLDALDIEAGGELDAGSYGFSVSSDLTNSGVLNILSGRQNAITGSFYNYGQTTITGSLSVGDALVNFGTVSDSGQLTVQGAVVNDAAATFHIDFYAYFSGGIANQGLIQTTGGGTLELYNAVLTGGTVAASNGGTVLMDQQVTLSSVTLTGTGGFVQGGSSYSYLGTYGDVLDNVTIDSGLVYKALDNNFTDLRGTIANSGTLTGGPLSYYVIDGPVTLAGHGSLLLNGGYVYTADNVSFAGRSTQAPQLINLDNTISGYGGLSNAIPLQNAAAGIINANDPNGRSLYLDSAIANQGLLEATSGGKLELDNAVVTGGTIAASNGGTVLVAQQTTLSALTLTGTSGFVQGGSSYSYLGTYGNVLQNVTIGSGVAYTALDNNFTGLRGTIANSGTLTNGSLSYYVIDGPVTLAGGGSLRLNGGYVYTANDVSFVGRSTQAAQLINFNNMISGYGGLSSALPLQNTASGIINANDPNGRSLLLDSVIANQGLLEATGGGKLELDNAVVTGGTVAASSGGTVLLEQQATLSSVTLAGTGGFVQGGSSYSYLGTYGNVLQNVTIAAGITYTALDNNFTGLRGTIANSGTLSNGPLSDYVIDGSVTLAGHGSLLLNGGSVYTANEVSFVGRSTQAATLVNLGNTISGYGGISGSMTLQNAAGGTINANAAGHSLSLSGSLVNNGLLEATNGGTLSLSAANQLTNQGTISVNGGALVIVGSAPLQNIGTILLATPGLNTPLGQTLVNTGSVLVKAGTLTLNGGGTSSGGVIVQFGGTIAFGAPSGGSSPVFTVTGGTYFAANTVLNGSTLVLSSAGSIGFASSLRLTGGLLQLGTASAAAAGSLIQSGATIAGSGTFTVDAFATFTAGLQTGGGTTRLTAVSTISGPLQLDSGRTLDNEGVLTLNGGSIQLGAGDSTAASHTATLTNAGVLALTGTQRIASPNGGGTISNGGVIIANPGTGEADIDAPLDNQGIIQLRSGTLGVNGGGSSAGNHIDVSPGATLRFGAPQGGSGSTFHLHGAPNAGGTIAVAAGTLTLDQGASGAGAFLLDGTATLDFVNGIGAGSSLAFLKPGGTLEADTTGAFGAAISGFTFGDMLDVTPIAFATAVASFSAGTLTVSDGAHSASFQLTGSYAPGAFHVANDGHGKAAITYG